jgi:hypothetical protein
MRRNNWGLTVIVVAAVLVIAGWFVLSFLTEPSAVGRMRTALISIGAGAIAVGAIGVVAGVWMLIARRT